MIKPTQYKLQPNTNKLIHTFLILDLLLDNVNSIRGFDLKGDGLTSECFDKDLHVETVIEKHLIGYLNSVATH